MSPAQRFRDLVASAPVLGDTVLTGGFLNHRVDVEAVTAAARELAAGLPPADVVLTAESGGIAPGFAVAQALGLPLVFARRSRERVPGDVLQVEAGDHHLFVGREALVPGAAVLTVDDILGNGRTPVGLAALASVAGARVVAHGVLVEKTFVGGRSRLEVLGVPVFALVRLARHGDGLIVERRAGADGRFGS